MYVIEISRHDALSSMTVSNNAAETKKTRLNSDANSSDNTR